MTRPPRPTRPATAWAALLACLAVGALLESRACRLPLPGDRPGGDAAQAPGLEGRMEALRRRAAARLRLGRDLIRGRVKLEEAASLAAALSRMPPPFRWEVPRARYPGASDEELHCRELII